MATTYKVAIWWPKEPVYSSRRDASSLEQSEAMAAEEASRGLVNSDKPWPNEVHIIKTTTEVIRWRPKQQP